MINENEIYFLHPGQTYKSHTEEEFEAYIAVQGGIY